MMLVPAAVSALLLATSVQDARIAPEMPAETLGEIKFATSPTGSDFFYTPGSGQIGPDRKTGKVRGRIVHNPSLPKLFESQAASSAVFFVFDCTRRTYLVDRQQDFDETGEILPKHKYPIVVGVPAHPVTKELEAVYAEACAQSSGGRGL